MIIFGVTKSLLGYFLGLRSFMIDANSLWMNVTRFLGGSLLVTASRSNVSLAGFGWNTF